MESLRSSRFLRLLLRGLAVLLAFPLLYFAAALAGGVVPANLTWEQPKEGVKIFIRSNGVHTWVMVPSVAAGIDWRPLAPAEHIADPRYAADYIAIGYGNREFYLNTPTWADLSPRTAIAAAFGSGPALVHVEHAWNPQPLPHQRPILLSQEDYRKLAAKLRDSFAFNAQGQTQPLIGRGYGPADIFYEANGHYNDYRTCNEWTGEVLRAAGVRTGVWTPLSQSIMWRIGGEG